MHKLMLSALLVCIVAVPGTAQTSVSAFTGGDVGEGLDLDGTFLYAVNVGGSTTGAVRNAIFTTDGVSGVTVTADSQITSWALPEYGPTSNDNTLEGVMESIRWSASPQTVGVTLTGLVPGYSYTLQLLFTESCCERGFDVFAEGNLIADEFSPVAFSGNDDSPAAGAVIRHTFVATDTTLNVVLDGNSASFGDTNPTLSAVTLELNTTAAIPALDASSLTLLALILGVVGFVVLRRV